MLLTYLDVVAEVVGHNPAQDVERDVGSGVPHVRVVVDGGPAGVPGHLVRVDRREEVLLPGESIKHSEPGLLVHSIWFCKQIEANDV